MVVLGWIVGVLVAVGFGLAGASKLAGAQQMVDSAERLGFTSLLRPIGAAEVLGAIGVLIGLIAPDIEWLGVLAAAGLVATTIGAVVYHRRGGDAPQEMAPAIVLGALSVVYIIALFFNDLPA
ncbi:MAG: DoxX family protein [Actinomycetota bacterium]